MKTQTFIVGVPALVGTRKMAAYMRDAIETWSGQFHPDDPLFGTLRGKVRIKTAKAMITEINNARARDAYKEHTALTELVDALRSLPIGHHAPEVVEAWLADDVKPAYHRALRALGEKVPEQQPGASSIRRGS